MIWIVILSLSLATFLLRSSFLLGKDRPLPSFLERALRYVPVAVLPALALNAILHDPGPEGAQPSIRWIAAIIAAIVAYKTRNILATMLIGMGTLWGLQALLA